MLVSTKLIAVARGSLRLRSQWIRTLCDLIEWTRRERRSKQCLKQLRMDLANGAARQQHEQTHTHSQSSVGVIIALDQSNMMTSAWQPLQPAVWYSSMGSARCSADWPHGQRRLCHMGTWRMDNCILIVAASPVAGHSAGWLAWFAKLIWMAEETWLAVVCDNLQPRLEAIVFGLVPLPAIILAFFPIHFSSWMMRIIILSIILANLSGRFKRIVIITLLWQDSLEINVKRANSLNCACAHSNWWNVRMWSKHKSA